ncbi:MAG: CRTAC1 family protein [Fuerstiella sp.]|nr:CRTAC1 family protein [Fuerstiella sp.]
MNRTCELPELGEVDNDAGEFWVANPFMLPSEGHNLSAYERNRMYLNVGGREFIDASRFSSADIDADSRSVVTADFDRDGRTDLLVGSVGGGPLRLFLNRLPANTNSIRLQFSGTESNRPAIGARCKLTCGARTIVRDLFASNGCMGQGPPEMLIGIGAATKADRLEVRWPGGQTQIWHDVPAGVSFRCVEQSSTKSPSDAD